MIILIITSFFICIVISLLSFSFPLGIFLIILLISVLSCNILNFFSLRFFRYLLIIIYVGRLLVIFSYFVRIDASQKLDFWPSFICCIISFPFLLYNTFWLIKKVRLTCSFINLFLIDGVLFILFICLRILITLVGVVKIRSLKNGSLRRFFSF